jgi:hypothetical protein
MDRLERIAELMASGRTTTPAHLRGSKGDCFAVCLQSMQWGMNPVTVGQKTHLVNGTLGYEAQLVSAVINSSGAVKDRFHFDWFGDWTKIIGRFKEVASKTKKDDNGDPKKYIVPAWEQADERGLGVRVWATLRGEEHPRTLELLLTQARTRNSTLWTEDPKQQLAYLAQKRWARLYAPDVILGVYTRDELEEPKERFMGMVDEIKPPPKTYDSAKFEANFPKWAETISTGRKTALDYINFAETRGEPYTEEQKARLLAVKAKPADVSDVQPKEAPAAAPKPAATYAEVAHRIMQAKEHADLDDVAALIGAVADAQQREELIALADKRAGELPPF